MVAISYKFYFFLHEMHFFLFLPKMELKILFCFRCLSINMFLPKFNQIISLGSWSRHDHIFIIIPYTIHRFQTNLSQENQLTFFIPFTKICIFVLIYHGICTIPPESILHKTFARSIDTIFPNTHGCLASASLRWPIGCPQCLWTFRATMVANTNTKPWSCRPAAHSMHFAHARRSRGSVARPAGEWMHGWPMGCNGGKAVRCAQKPPSKDSRPIFWPNSLRLAIWSAALFVQKLARLYSSHTAQQQDRPNIQSLVVTGFGHGPLFCFDGPGDCPNSTKWGAH